MKKFLFFGVLALAFVVSSCADYGEKIEKGKAKMYYKDGASEEDAQNILDALFKYEILEEDTEAAMQLLKDGDTHIFNVVIKEEMIDKEEIKDTWYRIGLMIKTDVLRDEDLIVNLCDDKLEPQKEIKID